MLQGAMGRSIRVHDGDTVAVRTSHEELTRTV